MNICIELRTKKSPEDMAMRDDAARVTRRTKNEYVRDGYRNTFVSNLEETVKNIFPIHTFYFRLVFA